MNARQAGRFGLVTAISLCLVMALSLFFLARALEKKKIATINEISRAINGREESYLSNKVLPILLRYVKGVSPLMDVFSSRSFYVAYTSPDKTVIFVRGIDLSSCRSLEISINGSQWTPADGEIEEMENLSYYYLMREFDILHLGEMPQEYKLVVNGQSVTVESGVP
jgi:hypothetical protein